MTREADKSTGELGLARRRRAMFLYGGLVVVAVIGLFLHYTSDRGHIGDIEPAAGASLVPEQRHNYDGQYTQ